MSFAEVASERLEQIGFRSTAPRRAVLCAIEGAAAPFTADELLGELPDVGRATVFRTIKLLQELDLVCRVPLEDGGVRYRLSGGNHHHHLVCRNCGVVTEFDAGAGIPEMARKHMRTQSSIRLRLEKLGKIQPTNSE